MEQRVAELEIENTKLAKMKSLAYWVDMKKDAERYLWIQKHGATAYGEVVHALWDKGVPTIENINAAIDAAMGEK